MKNLLFSLMLFTITASLEAQTKYFVMPGASGNGSSWATAGDFQTIVNGASAGDSVFVVGGTYQPSSGASYSMKEGIKIYGGFVGTETSLNQRSLTVSNSSILKGNNASVINNNSNNLTATAVLDGFIITGGITNMNFGGGMSNQNSSPTLVNLTFVGNSTQMGFGGGISNQNSSSPILTNVIFVGNSTQMGFGGGMSNQNSSPTLTNVIFVDNSAGNGNGGGMSNSSSSPTLTNVTFAGNNAQDGDGGGIDNEQSSSPTLTNCAFWSNTATIGADINNYMSTPIITYSYTQTTQTGAGNITGASDPFVNSSNLAGADGIYGTADDGLELVTGSTAIDAGDPLTNTNGYSVQVGNTDIAGNVRIINNRIDMGAYEYNSTLLPVTLIAFSGILQNGVANLQWHTGEEASFNHFEIEKNTVIAGGDWQSQPQGTIAAKGSNSNYIYSVPQPEPVAYYRLKMVDIDGGSKYSNIVMLSQSGNGSVPVLYPNPAKDYIIVKVSKAGNMRIYDVSGRLVKTVELQAGNNRIGISNLQSGIFYCDLKGNELRFVKE